LLSGDLSVINRAAWALGQLEAIEAVPKLVTVLITTEQRIVIVPVGGNVNTSGYMDATGAVTQAGGPLTPVGMTNSGMFFRTPPVVSNGAAAFGLVGVPNYEMVPGMYPGAGLSVGAQIKQGPEPRVATFTYRNVEVLTSLQKLTGQDFGYDVDAWHDWVSRSFNPHPRPARHVPQPLADEVRKIRD
jgi:hypothetical protein